MPKKEKTSYRKIHKNCLLNRLNGVIKKIFFALAKYPSCIITYKLSYGHISANYNLIIFYTQLNYRYSDSLLFFSYANYIVYTVSIKNKAATQFSYRLPLQTPISHFKMSFHEVRWSEDALSPRESSLL